MICDTWSTWCNRDLTWERTPRDLSPCSRRIGKAVEHSARALRNQAAVEHGCMHRCLWHPPMAKQVYDAAFRQVAEAHYACSQAAPKPRTTIAQIVVMSSTTSRSRGTSCTLLPPSGSVN